FGFFLGPSSVQELRMNVTLDTLTDIEMSWQKPEVLHGDLGGYQIDVVDMTNDNATYTFVTTANETSYRFNTSEEYERYRVTVAGFSFDLDNHEHRVLGNATPQIVFTSGHRPPRPYVEKQTEFEQTAVRLSWKLPASIIWNVTWYRVQTAHLDNFTQTAQFNFTELQPYQQLTVTLYGCTSRNAANCSQPRQLNRTTDVAAPTSPRGVSATNISLTSADVHWTRPATPNGPIHQYVVDLWETANVTTKHSVRLNGTDLKASFTELKKNTEYSVNITAVNKDSHAKLWSSPPASSTFTTVKTGGFHIWLAILLGCLTVAIISAGVVIYLRRRRAVDAGDTERLVRT
ncbi:phosphotidylinositol phosphatase PTPRQ-like, partial [Tropilaelaps mercedesae]